VDPRGPGEVDHAGELGDGEAVEVASMPLDGVVDAPPGHLQRIERVLGVGLLPDPQRPDVPPRGRQQQHREHRQAVADGDGDGGRRHRTGHPPELEPRLEAGERTATRRHRCVRLHHGVEPLAGDGGHAAEHERHQQHEGPGRAEGGEGEHDRQGGEGAGGEPVLAEAPS
jgi:hypothetical protein